MELYAPPISDKTVPTQSYINLLKGSWILIDIMAGHPQLPFFESSTHLEIQQLSVVSRSHRQHKKSLLIFFQGSEARAPQD